MNTPEAKMTTEATTYAIYRTAASGEEAFGAVVNRIIWNGTASYNPGEGLALVADPSGAYPIGSVYKQT